MKFRKIICPQDMSESALNSLKYAFELALEHQAAVLIVHASPEIFEDDQETMLRIPLEKFHAHENKVIAKLDKEFRELIECSACISQSELAALAAQVAYSISIISDRGHTGKAIVAFAEKEGADLIVTSKTGRSAVLNILLGSVSEYILQNAPCPVLVIPGRSQ